MGQLIYSWLVPHKNEVKKLKDDVRSKIKTKNYEKNQQTGYPVFGETLGVGPRLELRLTWTSLDSIRRSVLEVQISSTDRDTSAPVHRA
jgi:hypothetical protein